MPATGTRPKFDCITGVSTGALIATLAFLGPDTTKSAELRHDFDLGEDHRTRRAAFDPVVQLGRSRSRWNN